MKLCIVIQSEAFRDSAGMRIRYDRFRACLADPDVTLDALTSADLTAAGTLVHDVYIFCKTFDMTALLLARRIRAAGKIVGQDLFDDYFSQHDDCRLDRFRDWMRDMAPVTQFAICSTPRMVEVLRPYMPDIRIVAVDDPILDYDPLLVASLADAKVESARARKVLDVAWFGIGDNPYFPVGLADLVACEADLARIERRGWTVRLQIVTNRRPLEGSDAEVLRVFGIDHEVIEWTADAEREALVRAAVAILPVNGQSFSRAKSMNRAITALNGGCQVLSLGYPLYERIGSFLYRSADELIDDIAAGTCRVRGDRMVELTREFSTLANPFESAAAFVGEARRAMAEAGGKRAALPLICLINGRASAIAHHKAVNTLRGVSISTIFTNAGWNFPVRFDVVGHEMRMRVTRQLVDRYKLPVRDSGATVRIRDLDFADVDLAAWGIAPFCIYLPVGGAPLHDLALYEAVLRFVEACCRAAFGPVDILVGDTSRLKRRPVAIGKAA